MVYDGKTLKFYRNGFLMGQTAASGNLINNDYITTIGTTADITTIYPTDFIGYINEVRIWTIARSQAQIQQYMNAYLPTPDAQIGLQAYYQFNNLINKQGNSAWDASLLNNAAISKINSACALYSSDSCNSCSQNNNYQLSVSLSPNNKLTKATVIDNRFYGSDTSQVELFAFAWTANSIGIPYYNGRSLIKYDISDIPSQATVNSAKLILYAKTSGALNGVKGQPTYGTNNTGLLQKITSPWSLTGVNINNLPTVSSSSVILPQSTSTAQDYVLDITDYAQSWVKDPASNYGMLLRMQTENNPYNSLIFESGAATDSTKRPRLEICYTVPAITPVKVIDFSVVSNGGLNNISLTTANELNVAHIVLEKSANGVSFEQIKSFVPANNAKGAVYQFVEKAAENQVLYYRAKFVDIDGSIAYSKLVTVALSKESSAAKFASLFPNPAKNNQLINLRLQSIKDGNVQLKLQDVYGRTLTTKQMNVRRGVNNISLGDFTQCAKGTFYIQVNMDGKQNVLPLVLQ